jgi:hypothetical protein
MFLRNELASVESCVQDEYDQAFLSDRSHLEPLLSSCLRPLNPFGIVFAGV